MKVVYPLKSYGQEHPTSPNDGILTYINIAIDMRIAIAYTPSYDIYLIVLIVSKVLF